MTAGIAWTWFSWRPSCGRRSRKVAEALDLGNDSPTRRQFLARLQGQISKRGTIDVIRRGVKHGPHDIDVFYGTPSAENLKAQELYRLNRFSVTRQLRYSQDETALSLDLCLFINGLPIATFELKNSLTKQTVDDAVEQYKRDRNPRERLFELGRCLAHFAVDEHEVKFCTQLRGQGLVVSAVQPGLERRGGEPAEPERAEDGLPVAAGADAGQPDEHHRELRADRGVEDQKTGSKKRTQIWPRYHQLEVVRRLLADASANGAGTTYLIQHSAGSGKSNSIAWLAHQLIGLEREGETIFDSVIVVTDRRLLDQQIRDTIKQYAQVGSVVGHASTSANLRGMLQTGKRIVITTVQKFPFILKAIGDEHRGRRFAIIIDEAHSSQGGRTSAAVSMALSENGSVEDEDETTEDKINRLMESKKLLTNASYFAFTATPKNKTLEIFGTKDADDGEAKHRPFHAYTMKQAIQEGFIIDVVSHYTPVDSYYRLVKTVEGDPEFDTKRAGKKLRRYVEDHDHAIRLKAEIMVDHFHEQVAGQRIGGQARAMVVTSSIRRAVSYYSAIRDYLVERKSPYQGHRGVFRRARVRRREGDRVVDERVFVEPDCREVPGRPVPLPGVRGQVPDRLRRAAAAHDVRGQDSVGREGGADVVAAEPGAPEEARRLCAGLHQRRRDDPGRLCRLLPDDGAGRGDRRQPAARPAGDAGRRAGVQRGAGGRAGGAVPERSGPRRAGPDFGHVR